ncbi:hypothetical protein OG285_32745 [Streptomyces sp. NBC_01471]|uniref:hypothetical protein n=1 Tax=Streptomyces sp. NBC_01471 TaxID=2903879 RepID=UPI00324DCFDF
MPNHITTEITGPAKLVDTLTRTHTEAEREAARLGVPLTRVDVVAIAPADETEGDRA